MVWALVVSSSVGCFGCEQKITIPPQDSFQPLTLPGPLALPSTEPFPQHTIGFTNSSPVDCVVYPFKYYSTRDTRSWVDYSGILPYPWSHTPHLPSSRTLQCYLDNTPERKKGEKTPCRQHLTNPEALIDASTASRMKPDIRAASPGHGGVPSIPPQLIAMLSV